MSIDVLHTCGVHLFLTQSHSSATATPLLLRSRVRPDMFTGDTTDGRPFQDQWAELADPSWCACSGGGSSATPPLARAPRRHPARQGLLGEATRREHACSAGLSASNLSAIACAAIRSFATSASAACISRFGDRRACHVCSHTCRHAPPECTISCSNRKTYTSHQRLAAVDQQECQRHEGCPQAPSWHLHSLSFVY